jgi:hypothetical protein
LVLVLIGGYLLAAWASGIAPFGSAAAAPVANNDANGPALSGLQPSQVPETGGTHVVVSGRHLNGALVSLGGKIISATCASTACNFTAPPGKGVELLLVRTQAGAATSYLRYATPPTEPLAVGISFGDALPFMTPGQLGSALNDVLLVGSHWVQLDLDWADIQPSPGAYNWSNFDRVVTAADARHISLLPVLDYTPAFASMKVCRSEGEACPPANPAQFAAFAAAAVARYAPKGIHTWEIWNEPNSGRFWLPTPNANSYAALVKVTAAAMRKADPAAEIVLGALGTHELQSTGINALTYLRSLCADGVNKLVDAVAFQPFSAPRLPDSSNPDNAWTMLTGPNGIESILAAAGTPNLPIWITQTGASSGGPGVAASGPPPAGSTAPLATHLTPAYQAQFLTDSIAEANANLDVAAMFWYTDEDSTSSPPIPDDYYGLRTSNGTAKPSLFAMTRAIASLHSR